MTVRHFSTALFESESSLEVKSRGINEVGSVMILLQLLSSASATVALLELEKLRLDFCSCCVALPLIGCSCLMLC